MRVREWTRPGRVLACLLVVAGAARAQPSPRFTIEQVMAPGFAYELVSANRTDRIAWIEYERGLRNVYTAAAPDFRPVRVTSHAEDDGVDLTGLQISEDGEVVTFIRGHTANGDGWVANPTSDPRGAERAVWAASTRGGPSWRVVEANSYTLSPDGRWIAYARGGQIHRAAVNPGLASPEDPDDAEPLFRAYGQNGSPSWSPDGSRLAFVSNRGDHSYIGIYDVRTPRITYLAPGVDRDTGPAWSPDGTRIAFLRRPGLPFSSAVNQDQGGRGGGGRGAAAGRGGGRGAGLPAGMTQARFRGGYTLSIRVADVATGEGRELWHHEPGDDTWASVGPIRWVGDHLLFEEEPGNWEHWYSISVTDPEPVPVELTPGEGFVEMVSFDPNGRYLYYSANMSDIDRRDLYRVPVGGGRAEQLTKGNGIETYPAALASGNTVAVLYADARRTQSVAVVPARGGEARVITALPADYPLDLHVEPTNVTLTASDGLQFNNQLFLPPGLRAGEKRPAVIFVHGGPQRQMLLGYHYRHFYHMAYGFNQYLANKGYVVLSVNYRRGIGYGREFRTARNTGGSGNMEYQDVLAAGQYLKGRADVDTSRIGIWGLSYGGVLTAQALARNSELFKSGVDLAGVHLWGSSLDPESTSYQSSAISAIETWKSPVLLMHGDDDRNVDFWQTVSLVQLLRAHDVPFELIVFPDDVHDSLIYGRWLQAFNASDDFFDRTLIRKEPVRAEDGGR
jgi:dipeptidyl aminopeptidase/acylaminoacyl peptidase